MRLFRRRKNSGQVPADNMSGAPEVASQWSSSSRIDWKRALPRLVALVIILSLVTLGTLWATGVIGKNKPPAAHKPQQVAAVQGHGASQPAQSGTKTPIGTAPPTPAVSTPTAKAPVPAQNGPLTDTGPGETVAVFIVATAIGSIAYQLNLRRRLN